MWTKSLIALCIGTYALTMQGCSAFGQSSKGRSPPDASLTEPCPSLPLLTETTGNAALRWMIGAASDYNDCADKHRKLVEAVK